jgi:hypothetical protein
MYIKNNKITDMLIVSFIVLTTAASIGFYFSRLQTVALAEDKPV